MAARTGGARLAAWALAWLAGVAWQLQEAALHPPVHYAVVGLGGAAVAVLLALPGARAGVAPVLGVVAAAALGFGATGWRAGERLAEGLPAALEGVDLAVVGVVAALPQRAPWGVRLRLRVESAATAQGRPVAVPAHLALGWSAGYGEEVALTPQQAGLRAGQRWAFTVRLRQPHGHRNPHGFDYELMLFEQGVRATGSIRDALAPRLLAERAGHPVERARQRVRDAIEAAVAERRAAGVLAALAVGDQSAIERTDWELFRRTGIAHLVAISGLHVTMFAWLAGRVIGALWRRSARAALAWPAPLAAAWGGLLAAAAYAVFSGWAVPSQRTVWMLGAVTLLQSLGRRWPWALTLLAAAVVVTALDPWALLQAGFWLSFAAVGLLLASNEARPPPADPPPAPPGRLAAAAARVRAELRGQAVATVGLAPLTLVCFQQVSLVGFVANVVAIPWITLLVTPLALLGTLLAPLWSLGALALQGLCRLLEALAAWPGAVWSAPAAPAWAQAAGLAAAALGVAPLPARLRALALPLALPLLWPAVERPAPGRFELLAADVGQGTAVLVRTRAHLLVYDTGPRYGPDADAGERVLLPLLRVRGEARVHRLVLSHRDTDHVGGAAALLRGAPVDGVWSSLAPDHPLVAAAPAPVRCEAGQAWQWDGVRFEVLNPPPEAYRPGARPNALSCVVRVAGRGADGGPASALLAGDIEREQEARLVAAHGAALRADVLLAPHHGSRTSSSAAFLDAVQPRVAVVQAGYRNRFGHPAAEVVARYAERGIALVATPACGAWHWPGDREAPGRCERDAARRYWHHGGSSTATAP